VSQATTSALVPSSHSFVEQLNVGVTGGSEQWVSDDGKHKISQTIIIPAALRVTYFHQ